MSGRHTRHERDLLRGSLRDGDRLLATAAFTHATMLSAVTTRGGRDAPPRVSDTTSSSTTRRGVGVGPASTLDRGSRGPSERSRASCARRPHSASDSAAATSRPDVDGGDSANAASSGPSGVHPASADDDDGFIVASEARAPASVAPRQREFKLR